MMIFGVVTAVIAKDLAETLPSHDRWKVFEDVVTQSGITLYMSDDKKVITLQGMWQSLKKAHDLLEREYGNSCGLRARAIKDRRGRKSAAVIKSQRISSLYLKPSKSAWKRSKKWPKAPEPVVIFEGSSAPGVSGTADLIRTNANTEDMWNTQFFMETVSSEISGSSCPMTTTSSEQMPVFTQTSTRITESLHQNYNIIAPDEIMPGQNTCHVDSSKINENSNCRSMTIPEAIQIAINGITNDDVDDNDCVNRHLVNNVHMSPTCNPIQTISFNNVAQGDVKQSKALESNDDKSNNIPICNNETQLPVDHKNLISKDNLEKRETPEEEKSPQKEIIKMSAKANEDQQTTPKVSDEKIEGSDTGSLEHTSVPKRPRRKIRPPVRPGTVPLTDEHVRRKRGRPMKTEPTVVTLNCPDCDYLGKNKIDLRNHKQRFHAGSETGCFKCPVCDKQFSFEKDLKRHMTRHVDTRYPCDTCGKIYKDEKTMLKHKERHKEGWVRPIFPCNQCNKSFCTKFILKNHVKSVHLGQTRKFLCPTCGKSFTQKHVYLEHANIHLGIKPFVCDICNKAFAYEKSLKEHRFVHFEEKRFVCQVCSKAFRQKSILIVHAKIHKPIKDFLCRVCNRGFTQKQALLRHERVHNSEKPVHFNL